MIFVHKSSLNRNIECTVYIGFIIPKLIGKNFGRLTRDVRIGKWVING